MRVLFQYAIASGYNVALAALSNWESLTAGGRRFYAPRMYGSFNPGIYRVRGDGTIYIAGFGSCVWMMDILRYAQYRLLQTSYCSSGYSGLVTIYTQTDVPGTYARYNAVMTLPKHSESTPNDFIFEHAPIHFTRLEAL